MKFRVPLLLLPAVAIAYAAEEPARSSAREQLRARIAEDAKKADKADAKKPAPAANSPAATATPPPAASAAAAAEMAQPASKNNAAAAKESPTVLPKVEVRKDRVTELDVKLAQQNREIEREKKNLKSSELDNALNDAKLARPLAIFGGDSTQFRKGVAAERIELMEAEKDVLEAIAHAKTKDEKAALQKQLDELRTIRRQLDKSLR